MSVEYSQDGTVLIKALLEPGETELSIREGCKVIAEKAFMYQKDLHEVNLPSTLERIGDFAFSCTGLTRFEPPLSLKRIGKKAFYQCKDLTLISLNEGLERLDAEAFSFTAIAELALPSTVSFIGHSVVLHTPLAQDEDAAGFTIDSGNDFYMRDDQGGLYRLSSVGMIFYELLSQVREHHKIQRGTRSIGQKAYYRNAAVRSVDIPEGVIEIGKKAFDHAIALERADLPETLECIGELAFRDTSLKCLHLPAHMHKLGDGALLTGKRGVSTLVEVTVDPQNMHFYTQNGFLIQRICEEDYDVSMLEEREPDYAAWASAEQQSDLSNDEMMAIHMAAGQEHALVYFGQARVVVVPNSVRTIAYNCIAVPQTIDELYLHRELTQVHPFAIASHCQVKTVIVQLKEPICGGDTAVVPFIEKKTFYPTTYSFFPEGCVTAEYLFEQSDRITYFSHKTFERSKAMLDRLDCPQFLLYTYHKSFIETLTRGLMDTCKVFADHEYLKGFDQLREQGLITQDNIQDVINTIRESASVVVVGYLLQMRREHFHMNDLQEDFAL